MELIEGVALSQMCDYSFGDQAGQWSGIYTHFMKEANLMNFEFVSKVFEIKRSRDYMTLFIDNIRLYNRRIQEVSDQDWPAVRAMMQKSNLLNLCGNFSDMKFIIFTNLEDTPIDDYIFESIPKNVLKIYAANALSHGGKVVPAPYGVQRKMHPRDNRSELLLQSMVGKRADKLLYVSHKEDSHPERIGTRQMFMDKLWTKVDTTRVEYTEFLENLSNHKFMLCPRGNAIDCHRNWEVLYMRRVPVMKRHPYLEELFKDYPVLFVDDYSEVTEDLLKANENLYQRAQEMDLSQLYLPNWFENCVREVT
tara:strand:- start:2211 stop:3134 length:924 start_codon:yes stop_codon:yes gene_type:complete